MLLLLLLLPLLAGCTIESGMARIIGVRTIEPHAAARLLETRHPVALDTRDRSAFEAGHLPGSALLTLEQIDGYLARLGAPRDRPVLAVCYRGHASQVAAAMARTHGFHEVYSLAGGIERWRGQGLPLERGAAPTLDSARLGPPAVQGGRLLQTLVAVAGLGLGPLSMLLALAIVLALRGARERNPTLIRQGMAVFFVGEGLGALSLVVGPGTGDTLALLHGVGLVALGALLPWGLFGLVDGRPRARRLARLVPPALAAVALAPLCSPLRPLNVAQPILGAQVIWRDSVTVLLVEQRLFPVLASFHFLLAAWKLRKGDMSTTRVQGPFFWGLGFMIVALARYLLARAYPGEPGWPFWWEKSTTLVAVAAAALLLRAHREPLGLARRAAEEEGDGSR